MTTRPPFVIVALFIAFALVAADADAQSDRDLRQENDRLKSEIADLRQEYDTAQRRIVQLEARIKELETLLAGGGGTPPPPPPPVTIDETQPNASPGALLRALRTDYQETLGEMDRGDGRSRVRVGYFREVERWVNGVNRAYRKPITWHVRVLDGRRVHGRIEARLQAVDPVSDAKLGEPFWVVLRERVASHLRQLEARQGDLDVLVLDGVLVPTVEADEQRETEDGAFNDVPLVGPFAVFGFDVDVRSLALPPRETEADEGSPPDTTPTGGPSPGRRDR